MMVMADLETQGHHHHHPQCTSFSLDGHPSKYWAGQHCLTTDPSEIPVRSAANSAGGSIDDPLPFYIT